VKQSGARQWLKTHRQPPWLGSGTTTLVSGGKGGRGLSLVDRSQSPRSVSPANVKTEVLGPRLAKYLGATATRCLKLTCGVISKRPSHRY